MRVRLSIASAAGLLLAGIVLSGCWTVSVNPLFSDDTLIYDEGLLGTWQRENLVVIFTPAGEKTYRLRLIDKREKNKVEVLEGRLVKLGDQHYLDLMPPPLSKDDVATVHRVDGHSIWKISLQGDTLRLIAMDFEWLRDLLDNDPKALKAARVEKYSIVLAASTAELQQFVQANSQQAFKERESDTWQRVPARKKR